ncbi:MAG: hypothetical protein IJ057_09260 [Bacteroidales bacterium]|nr:hypothetical protein [Bacteroidales bacterium]
MKKVALLIVAVLFATVTFAQSNLPIDPKTEKICFRKVINTVGSEDEVYNRIFSGFMNKYYKSPATLLNQNDGRTMKGKHQFQLDNGDEVKSKWPWITYRFVIEVREGRVRYTLTDFMQKTQSNHTCEEWMDKEDPQYQPIWDSYLQQIAAFAEDWGQQFEESLEPEKVIEEEEW